MKRSIVFAIGLLFLGLVCFFFLGNSKDTAPLEISPDANWDGTTDYTLIFVSTGNDETYKKILYWTLRFPENSVVEIPEDYSTETAVSDKKFYDTHPVSNRVLRFYYSLQTGDIQKWPMPTAAESLITVSVLSRYQKYGTGRYEGSGKFTFSSMLDNIYNLQCAKEREIVAGVFRLRELSKAEVQAIRKKYGEEVVEGVTVCPIEGNTFSSYSVFDDAGKIVGGGTCNEHRKSYCRFTFHTPQSRWMSYEFRPQHLARIHEFHEAVSNILTSITVDERSVDNPSY